VVSNKKDGIKLLGYGNLRSKIDIKVSKASASARAAVEKAGGRIILITDEEKK
jgi:large subunit ribosomal protein L15